jgi:pimeloyl-ACP methyl ester carboxylesterase
MDHRYRVVDGLELHTVERGPPDAPPVLCLHGLSRVARDFDPFAHELRDQYRVIALDLPGRGESEWASDPERYRVEHTAALVAEWCRKRGLGTDATPLRVVGTSLGGRVGLHLAGDHLADRVSHLVLNDTYPEPSAERVAAGGEDGEGLDRIQEYLQSPPTFERFSELAAYVRETYDVMAPQTDAEWRRMARTSARRTDEGAFTPNYDTRVVAPVFDEGTEIDERPLWRSAPCAAMVVRAAESDVLSASTHERMLTERPGARSLEVEGGHPPPLNVPEQVAPIREFLA